MFSLVKSSIVTPLNSASHLGEIIGAGAGEVYFGIWGALNSRNFSQLNISPSDLPAVVKECKASGVKSNVVLNSFPISMKGLQSNEKIIRKCKTLGVDAVIAASFSVMGLIKKLAPKLPIHVSVMSAISSPEGINFLANKFNIERTIQAPTGPVSEIASFRKALDKDISLELISFGTMSYGFQGNCHLSNFLSGKETNIVGCCSHPNFLSLKKQKGKWRLCFGKILFKEFEGCPKGDLGTLANHSGKELLEKEKGSGWKNTVLVNKRYVCRSNYKMGRKIVCFQGYEYLNVLPSLQKLREAGVDAFKIEGRQRPPEYAVKVTELFSDLIKTGNYSKQKLKALEEEFFPGMKPFQGGLTFDQSS